MLFKIQIVESTRKDVIFYFSWEQQILRSYFADAYTDLPVSLWMIADDFSAIVTLFLKKSSRNIFSSCTCTSISRSFLMLRRRHSYRMWPLLPARNSQFSQTSIPPTTWCYIINSSYYYAIRESRSKRDHLGWEDVYHVHSVWKSQKSLIQHCERSELHLHLTFTILAFSPIFVWLKLTSLVTLYDRKLQVFKNSPKWTIIGIFN